MIARLFHNDLSDDDEHACRLDRLRWRAEVAWREGYANSFDLIATELAAARGVERGMRA